MPRPTTPAVLAALLALGASTAACSSGPRALPKPDGAVFRLNPDRWGETVNDFRPAPPRAPPRPLPQEARR